VKYEVTRRGDKISLVVEDNDVHKSILMDAAVAWAMSEEMKNLVTKEFLMDPLEAYDFAHKVKMLAKEARNEVQGSPVSGSSLPRHPRRGS